jgi:hypothetical protein
MAGQTAARTISSSTFFTLMRAERKLWIPLDRCGYALISIASTAAQAARLSTHARTPAPRIRTARR